MEFLTIYSSINSPQTTLKKSRKIRVATKVNEKLIIDKSLEKDFLLEKGDPLDFLKIPKIPSIQIPSRESLSRFSSIFSQKPLDAGKDSEAVSSSRSKREISRRKFTVRGVFRPIIDKEFNVENKIKQIFRRLEENKKEEQQKIKNFSRIDRLVYQQQQACLNNFEKTKKNWKKIENGLKKKIQKKELVSNRSREVSIIDHEKSVPWNMTLRQTNKNKLENLIPVGNKLSGLYLKEVIDLRPAVHQKSSSCPDLTIFGDSKLPLEISAVQKNSKYIQPKLQEEVQVEEVLAENYSKRRLKFS